MANGIHWKLEIEMKAKTLTTSIKTAIDLYVSPPILDFSFLAFKYILTATKHRNVMLHRVV